MTNEVKPMHVFWWDAIDHSTCAVIRFSDRDSAIKYAERDLENRELRFKN